MKKGRTNVMNSKDIVAGLDIGTTGVKALIADRSGKVLGLGYREYPCLFPHPGGWSRT